MSRHPDYPFSLGNLIVSDDRLHTEQRKLTAVHLTHSRPSIVSKEHFWEMEENGSVLQYRRKDLTNYEQVMRIQLPGNPKIHQFAIAYDFMYLATTTGLWCVRKDGHGHFQLDSRDYRDVVVEDSTLAGLHVKADMFAHIRCFHLEDLWMGYSETTSFRLPVELRDSSYASYYSFCLIGGVFYVTYSTAGIIFEINSTGEVVSTIDGIGKDLFRMPFISTWDPQHFMLCEGSSAAGGRVSVFNTGTRTWRRLKLDDHLREPVGALMLREDCLLIVGKREYAHRHGATVRVKPAHFLFNTTGLTAEGGEDSDDEELSEPTREKIPEDPLLGEAVGGELLPDATTTEPTGAKGKKGF